MSVQKNNINMNPFQEEDANNYNPNSSPKEEMVSSTLLFKITIFYLYRKLTLIVLKIIITAK